VTKTINPKFLKIDDIRIFKNHCMKHVKDVQENKVFVDKFFFPCSARILFEHCLLFILLKDPECT